MLAIVLLVPLLANLVTVLIAIANGSTSWTLLVVHTVLVFVMTLTAVIRCLFLREVRPDRQGEVPVTAAGDRPVAATRRMEKDQQQVSAISPPPHTVVSCRNAAKSGMQVKVALSTLPEDSVCVMATCEFGMLLSASLVFRKVALGQGQTDKGHLAAIEICWAEFPCPIS